MDHTSHAEHKAAHKGTGAKPREVIAHFPSQARAQAAVHAIADQVTEPQPELASLPEARAQSGVQSAEGGISIVEIGWRGWGS